MGRPKASDPRNAQLLIRLTAGQMRLLEAVSHLEGKTTNAYAHELLADHLETMRQHPRVQTDLENRAR